MNKLIWSVIVIGLLAGGGVVGWRAWQKWGQSQAGGRPRSPMAVAVEVADVQRVTLRQVGLFTGSLEADSRFIVASQVAGRLKRLRADIGDRIATSQPTDGVSAAEFAAMLDEAGIALPPGDPIAEIDDREFVQQVERARAESNVASAALAEAESNMEIARKEFARTEELFRREIASQSAYEQAAAQLKAQQARRDLAEAQVLQRQAALEEARIRLSYTRIYPTWSGGSPIRLIGERFVDEGALLSPNSPIVSVIDIGTLTANIHVTERDYNKISVRQPTRLTTDAQPGRQFDGYIERIGPQLQESSRQAHVRVRVDNADGLLRPGMFVRVHVELAVRPDAQAVPAAALARRDGQRGVFEVDLQSNRARFVPVETGIAGRELVEVISPALTGPVVVLGQHLLADGGLVRVVASEPATTMPAKR